MDAKPLAEWPATADGLIKVAMGLIGSIGMLLAAVTGHLKPLFNSIGLPQTAQALVVVPVVTVLGCFGGPWRSAGAAAISLIEISPRC